MTNTPDNSADTLNAAEAAVHEQQPAASTVPAATTEVPTLEQRIAALERTVSDLRAAAGGTAIGDRIGEVEGFVQKAAPIIEELAPIASGLLGATSGNIGLGSFLSLAVKQLLGHIL